MQINLPAFGAVIAGQGGHFAGIMRGHTFDGVEQEPYALIISPKSADILEVAWGPYGEEVKDADSRANGAANTAAMLTNDCPAATAVNQFEHDGHKDFFLPALGQLNAAAANVPELFDSEGVYWTSTQYSRHYAFVQDFAGGGSGGGAKDDEVRVRPFRQIPLHLLTT